MEARIKWHNTFQVLKEKRTVNSEFHIQWKYPSGMKRKLRQWQPTPVFLPGKSHGWRSPVGFSPWGHWVGHDWATSLPLFTFMHWRGKWQPTPVFLPGKSHRREPGGLLSMGLHRVGHDWSDLAAANWGSEKLEDLPWSHSWALKLNNRLERSGKEDREDQIKIHTTTEVTEGVSRSLWSED